MQITTKSIIIEAKAWGLAIGLGSLIAGASLGAILSRGDYIPWTLGGALLGLVLGTLSGMLLAVLWEVLWGLGVWLMGE